MNPSNGRVAEPARANHAIHSHLTDADRVGISGLNDNQWKTLAQMLNERKLGPNERLMGTFFLDLGSLTQGLQIT